MTKIIIALKDQNNSLALFNAVQQREVAPKAPISSCCCTDLAISGSPVSGSQEAGKSFTVLDFVLFLFLEFQCIDICLYYS